MTQKAVSRSTVAELLALDQGGAERQVGEDHHEAREDERQRGEAVLLGGEETGDRDRRERARELEPDLRSDHPAEASEHARAEVREARAR